MIEKRHIELPAYSWKKRLEVLGFRAIFALFWYAKRTVVQKTIYIWYKTIGKYGFSKIGKKVVIDGCPSFILPCSLIYIGDNSRIGKRCVFQGNYNLPITIGSSVTINDGCIITSLFSITIGDSTSIGEYCSIRDYNHEFRDPGMTIKNQGYFGAPISIGKGCWIGRGCTILPGITIGDGAVIGANSVVTKDVPENSIVGGIPAKILKYREYGN